MVKAAPATLSSLYVDPAAGGARVSTHSMIKTFRRCPKQADYKYSQRLKPKEVQKNLHRGKWMHKLLELFHLGEDWRAEHARWTHRFDKLFDEEKERLGDMPREILRMIVAYIWHYKADEWEVLDCEFIVETRFPDGTIYRAKIDMLIRNQFGLWLVDHKTHKKLPDHKFRLLDSQSALYLWAALREKLGVEGFIWNYVRWKPPTVPQVIKDGSRLSKKAVETDYPTLLRTIRKAELDPTPYLPQLRTLKAQRYQPGEPQVSPFFRRDVLEKSPQMLRNVALAANRTSKAMHSYDFSNPDAVERVPDRRCIWDCSYTDLCTIELMGGGNPDFLRRKLFYEEDPLAYINDDEKDWREMS
jgi:hypothetical protein